MSKVLDLIEWQQAFLSHHPDDELIIAFITNTNGRDVPRPKRARRGDRAGPNRGRVMPRSTVETGCRAHLLYPRAVNSHND
jgi:hypothetical protein